MSMAPILSKVKVVAAGQCGRNKASQGQSDMFTYVSFSNLKNKKSVSLVSWSVGVGSTDNMSRTNSLEGRPESTESNALAF